MWPNLGTPPIRRAAARRPKDANGLEEVHSRAKSSSPIDY